VRTITEGNTVLFCGSDVAKALGYDKPANAVAIHCSTRLKRTVSTESKNRYGSFTRQMEMTFIPESDLYRLITHSKLPDAKKFERWIFDNLSSIKHNGVCDTTPNDAITTVSGIPCYEKDGVAYLNLEACVRGLGFTQTQTKNSVVYTSVRWETVRQYLADIGFDVFPNKLGKDGLPVFIPETIFYRLAMKANNETAKRFQAFVANEVLPSIRKHGAYVTKPA